MAIWHLTVDGMRVSLEPWSNAEAVAAPWLELESRALEPNAFLSPLFVFPAVRYLVSARTSPWLLTVRPVQAATRWLLLALVRPRAPRPRYPLPHLVSWRSPHSYLGGLLVDRDETERALHALCAFLASPRTPWCGLFFDEIPGHGLFTRLQSRSSFGRPRWQWDRRAGRQRARLVLQSLSADSPPPWSGRDEKEYRRLWRRLSEQGALSWEYIPASALGPSHIEDFLRLEDQGWKQARAQSLRARSGHELFFREMVEGFRAAGRVFFCELRLDGRPIASANYLLAGEAGFAFKIGWDVRYAKFAPGILNEVAFVREVGRCCPQLRYIDSGAQSGSFIERLWPHRIELEDAVLVTGRTAVALLPVLRGLRRLWRRYRPRREPEA
jgi:hypothetical protein